MKFFKSLHFALVIKYTVFFIISIVAIFSILLFCVSRMVNSIQEDEVSKYVKYISVSGDYNNETLVIENMPSNLVWFDVIENNKVVYSEGDRGFEQDYFSDEELNSFINEDVPLHKSFEYIVKPYVYNTESGNVNWILMYSRIDTSVNLGVNVPDEFKGTVLEDELKNIGNLMWMSVLLALIVVILSFSIITYRMLIKPIRKLNAGMLAVKQGELGTYITYKGYNELSEMTNSFNIMTMRLKRAEEEARHQAESKKTLLMNISHDLRSPATVVQGYSQALADGVVPDEKKKEYYEFINSKSTMITNRLNQLFNYVKLDLTEFDLSMEVTEFNEFIRRLTINYLPNIEAKNQVINLFIEEKSTFVKLDHIEMERAIGNLIENAVKYNPEGTVITIKLDLEEDCLKLYIQDNGIGIPERETIFAPFVRGDKTRKSEGTGLGVAISKQIIEKHSGELSLCDVEVGTKFLIELPIH